MSIYSKDINILDDLNINLTITKNKYNLDLENIFSLAARKNPKRAFLFVSKLLGKHLPINPNIGICIGYLLANEITNEHCLMDVRNELIKNIQGKKSNSTFYEYLELNKLSLSEKTLFIGFAETATGLGHSIFNSFSKNAYYIHTTREKLLDIKPSFEFQEEHSHATSHLFYLLDNDIMNDIKRIVLIDDEITTGKTNLNIIKELYKKYKIKNFTCVSILDWRNKKNLKEYDNLMKELNIKINVISLISGQVECNNHKIDENNYLIENSLLDTNNILEYNENKIYSKNRYFSLKNNEDNKNFLISTGRFGLDINDNTNLINDIYNKVKLLNLEVNKNTLIMGFGEFIYIPMVMAYKLNKDCLFSSPSLSPIYTIDTNNYPLKNVDIIECPYDINNNYHIYNLNNSIENVILFLERRPSKSFISNFKKIIKNRGIKKLDLIYFY